MVKSENGQKWGKIAEGVALKSAQSHRDRNIEKVELGK